MKREYQCAQQIEKNTTRECTRKDLVFSSCEITLVGTIFCLVSYHDVIYAVV